MTRRFISSALLMFLLLMVPFTFGFKQVNTPVPHNGAQPNIIIIFMDDMGYGDLECYGGFPYH
ncbi:MAG TPA: hypothetical protein PLL71_05435, partial [Agriterribacter sp.]|nr:hypothetical protein [Agriterribacter sp.]